MAQGELEFGIQECSKCRYKIRCEECVYNEKDIAELLRQEKKATAKNILKFAKPFIDIEEFINVCAEVWGVEVE